MQQNRRQFLKKSLAAAGSGVVLSGRGFEVTLRQARPNVIYILADDLGYGDLGCYGQRLIKTPNLDRMAAEGVRFTQHYAGTTVCAPARCSLMTGQHTGHCYVRGNKSIGGYNLALPRGTFTLAMLFKQAGYATACIGKWGLGGPGTSGHPHNVGFDRFYGYLSQGNAHFYYPQFLWSDGEQVILEKRYYSHDLITEQALAFIRRNKDNPFFLYLPYTIPHAEILVPDDEILAGYRTLGWPETPYFGSHYGDQPTPRAAFAAMITRMDRDIGRIIGLLRRLGLDRNTIVMFSSDNGPHSEGGADPAFFNSAGPYRGIKRDLYEGGIRVPFIVRWPGTIEPGRLSGHVSAFWDVLPSCAELLGRDLPSQTDGISFLPELLGRRQRPHQYLYWEFHEQGGKQAVLKGNHKALRVGLQNEPDPPVRLYDLKADPGETTDIAARRPGIAQELKALMAEAHSPSDIFKFYGE